MWVAVVLGLVQGLAEFLPISSSGHLLVGRYLLGASTPGIAWETALHLGTLTAIIVAYRNDLRSLFRGFVAGDALSRRLIYALLWASVPAAIVGVVGGAFLTQILFRPPIVAIGFAITTGLLWTTPAPERGQRGLTTVDLTDAWWIGVAQAIALVPGLSRSGATMVMARWRGLTPLDAARFSFLMALPATIGAAALNVSAIGHLGGVVAAGGLVAFLTGLAAMNLATRAIRSQSAWRGFGWYTLMLAFIIGERQ